jgi:phage terminase large subunit-like protein
MKSDLKVIIQRALREVERKETERHVFTSLFEVIAHVSPELERPQHLWPYIKLWDYIVTKDPQAPSFFGGRGCVVHAPPQHGKSLAGYHGLVFAVLWDLQQGRPPRHHAYSTYNQDKANESLKVVTELARRAGLDPRPSGPHLHLAGGAVIHFGGVVTGTLTGHKVDGIHLIDDPIKDRADAMSALLRERLWNWYLSVAKTREHKGASTIVMHTRWSHDDFAGRLIRERHWDYLRIAEECDDEADDPLGRKLGQRLWPEHHSDEQMAENKLSALVWESMYQGRPRPLGDALFQEPAYYDELPKGGYKFLYGADLAYTGTTRSDWSVLLGGRLYKDTIYLTSMLRKQVQADQFTRQMKAALAQRRGPILWFGNSVEAGAAALIKQQIPLFQFRMATADKYIRAMPVADKLWNQKKILLPRGPGAEWVEAFVYEVCQFTGHDDSQDDQVDALAALGHLCLRSDSGDSTRNLTRTMRAGFRKTARVV